MEHNRMVLSLFLTISISCIECKPTKQDGAKIITNEDSVEFFSSQNVDDISRRKTKELAKYFSTYGYTPSYTENVKDLKESIKNFQYFGGLLPTGKLDSPTYKLMQTDRCGMKDPIKSRRVRRYNRQGSRWEKETLTWRYEHNTQNENARRLGEYNIRAVLKRAMELWEAKTNIEFVEDRSVAEPDVWVTFASRRHNDPWAFDGPGGTLAHAFYPMNNKGLAGDVHFDDDEYFTLREEDGGKSLYWVALHELGHTLGLDHSRTQSAIMYPYYTGYRKEVKLDYDDILGIQTIYGGKRRKTTEKPTEKPGTTPKTTTETPETTTQPKPKTTIKPTKNPDREIPLNKRCQKGKITAFWDYRPARSYMFVTDNERLYVVYKNGGGIMHANIDAKGYYRGISEKIDAIYQSDFGKKSKRVYDMIFSGRNYYLYEGFRQISGPHSIKKLGLPSDLKRVDAAMKWWPNNKVYFFSGQRYWRYDEATMKIDGGYPKQIVHGWKGLPGQVDSAYSSYETQETLFTIGDQIYRMQERPWPVRVKQGYPKGIKTDLLNCEDV